MIMWIEILSNREQYQIDTIGNKPKVVNKFFAELKKMKGQYKIITQNDFKATDIVDVDVMDSDNKTKLGVISFNKKYIK